MGCPDDQADWDDRDDWDNQYDKMTDMTGITRMTAMMWMTGRTRMTRMTRITGLTRVTGRGACQAPAVMIGKTVMTRMRTRMTEMTVMMRITVMMGMTRMIRRWFCYLCVRDAKKSPTTQIHASNRGEKSIDRSMSTCVSEEISRWCNFCGSYSQFSPCGHLAITDTPIKRTAAKSQEKPNYRRLTEINSRYYGLSLMRTLT